MNVTFFIPPSGRQQVREITNVRPEDAEFFATNKVEISMEELVGNMVVYANTGHAEDDGTPMEIVELSRGRTCEDTLTALRKLCEVRFADKGNPRLGTEATHPYPPKE